MSGTMLNISPWSPIAVNSKEIELKPPLLENYRPAFFNKMKFVTKRKVIMLQLKLVGSKVDRDSWLWHRVGLTTKVTQPEKILLKICSKPFFKLRLMG